MKILGNSNRDFIVIIGDSELEKLTGFYYGKSDFRAGQIIHVDKLYDKLTKLESMAKEISKIQHQLKTAVGVLDKIDPIFEPKKDEGE